MQKSRIKEVEILRSAAFIAVVLQHVLGSYVRQPSLITPDNVIIGIVFGLAKFAVPMFVFLSGVVLFYSYYNNLNYFKFIKKRVFEILIPYIIWSTIYIIWHGNGYAFWRPSWLSMFVKNILLGNASYHLWYVVMILQAFILLPLFFASFKILQKRISSVMGFVLVLLFITMAYILLIKFNYKISGISVIGKLFVKYSSKNFFFYSIYFILGGICALYYEKWKIFVLRFSPLTFTGFILMYIYVEYILFKNGYTKGVLDLNYMGSLNIRFFLFSVLNIVFLYAVAIVIAKKFSYSLKTFAFIGKNSFQAYLIHAIILSYVARPFIKQMNVTNKPVFFILIFVLTTVASVLAAYIVSRMYKAAKNTLSRLISNKEISDAKNISC